MIQEKLNAEVISVYPNKVKISIDKLEDFKIADESLKVGSYLRIADNEDAVLIAIIENFSIEVSDDGNRKYIIEANPLGIIKDNRFVRGGDSIAIPPKKVEPAKENEIRKVYEQLVEDEEKFTFSSLSSNQNIKISVDGNKFFSKHIAIVGSTGSGKSCTVAKILQYIVGINKRKNIYKKAQKNSHIIIFDIHSEYKSAFTIENTEEFNLNVLDVDKLKLPYWLMNSEELEALFIESNEQNSHNQVSQFKHAVILNKEKYNPELAKITYDTPVYFCMDEVCNYIHNKNNLTVYRNDSRLFFASSSFNEEYSEKKLWNKIDFEQSTGNAKHEIFKVKVSKYGGFNGEFDRFISRLETKINDKRLAFLLKPVNEDGKPYQTDDFKGILKQFLGYLNKSNITIIDLSGIPFEVLSITVSLISRLVFDFAFHYSKLKHLSNDTNDIPFMIVCEEAHNYIPKSGGAEYKASKKSIERIAKEGRKYGLSLMVVSQRPSEVSDTIFSQCNNFLALRLTNINDQGYIKGLLPDNVNSVTNILPTLSVGECIVVGDAIPMPAIVKMEMPNPKPNSENIKVHNEWKEEWKDITFDDVIKRWKKE